MMMKLKSLTMLISIICVSVLTPAYAQVDFTHPKNASPIMIFVSFSMPKESLKGWLREAHRVHAPVIIRGLINNSFKETIKAMTELTKDKQGGVQLNPLLFEQFHIEKVPAVVVALASDCMPNQTCQIQYDVTYGDTTLKYALNKISDQNDSLSDIAKNALTQLRDQK